MYDGVRHLCACCQRIEHLGPSQGEFLCFSFSLHFFVAAFLVLLLFL